MLHLVLGFVAVFIFKASFFCAQMLMFSVPKREIKESIFLPILKLLVTNGTIVPEHDTPPRTFLMREMNYLSFHLGSRVSVVSILSLGKCEHLEVFSFSFLRRSDTEA